MLKYTTTEVTFREIPDEITLCINISGCPIHCPDCHSKELWQDIGEELTEEKLCSLIEENKGITCVCFMGGENDYLTLFSLTSKIKSKYPNLKLAWYRGKTEEEAGCFSRNFTYVKYGPYIKELGGLDSPTTNQRLYIYFWEPDHLKEDITYKFWKNDANSN